MARPPKVTTPEQRIDRAARWAERQGLINVAADLRQALADLEARKSER